MSVPLLRRVVWYLNRKARRTLLIAGYELVRTGAARMRDQPVWVRNIIERVRPYTMTSPERITALCNAVQYISRYDIPGDIVECGVWRGGSMMAAALTLMHLGDTTRRLVLFDTFEGMTPSGELDRDSVTGFTAAELLAVSPRSSNYWGYSPLKEVCRNVGKTNYPSGKIDFVKGPVEKTIPESAPDRIALLRLDTDWYNSTRHELIHLYPRLSAKGVLIIDDYGEWEGARKAMDDYVFENGLEVFLSRVDRTGRLLIKP